MSSCAYVPWVAPTAGVRSADARSWTGFVVCPLANGVPVDDTIPHCLALSVSGFQECFKSWVDDVVTLSEGEMVAVDGHTDGLMTERKA